MEQSVHQRFHYKDLAQLRADLDRLGLSLSIEEDVSILADRVRIGAKEAPNRFVVLPMEGFDAAADGSPRELTFRRYKRYAAGGAGLIWFEATAILHEARSNPAQLFIHRGNVDVYRRLVEETRRAAREVYGWEPILIVQLTHSGRYSKPAGVPAPMIAHHSAVLDPLHKLPADYPLVTDAYLDRLQDTYVEAARLAAEAGFDGVDIKSCHRYLLSELLASHTREGKYGGSFENRTRMLRETVQKVAGAVPGVFVTVRLNTYDGIPHPYGFGVDKDDHTVPDPSEPLALIETLKAFGLPVISPTIGNPYYIPHLNRPFDFPIKGMPVPDEHPLVGVARFLAAVRVVQEAYPDLPVIGSGYSWLRHLLPNVAAGVVKTGGATLIGQGRGSFAYPDSVRDILQTGKMDPAKCCVACSACTQIMRDGASTGCVVRDSEIYGPQYRLGRRYAMDRLQEEARRCRECEQPTCVRGCPAGIDIPRFLKAFADGDIKTAYDTLREKNVLPEMCAYVCPKQEQCEGGCVERIFCEHPVAIGDIQLVTARTARLQGITGVRLPREGSGKEVAVVGGGPAGLACAVKLLEAGHMVTIYEKGRKLGGTPDSLIPTARYGDAEAEVDAVLAPAIAAGRLRIQYGRSLSKDLSLSGLRAEHAAVFLAMGLSASMSLGGAPGVEDALGFLARVKRGELRALKGRVAVIGGGNTAIDAAVTAKQLGADDVYLVYRRSYLQMPAWEEDRDVLLKRGVEPLFLTQPLGYVTADGKLTGLRVARTELGPADASGRRRPRIVPGSESVLPVTMAIEAMGQGIPVELREALGDLVSADTDRVQVLPGSSATKIQGVYAGGDLVNGGRTAVQAVAEGMRAAEEIDAYLQEK
ncbi:MAG: FAD-dependent oxidoreductase [Bacteroidota bacterium]